jgi:transcriptional regulator with XRE-family HTH domain
MAKTPGAPRHYIKQWRDKAGLSLARLAARMESTPGEEMISAMSLSRIERGLQPYSEPILAALSVALDVPEWALISVNPEKEGEVVDLMRLIRQKTPAEREQAIRLIKAVENK